MSELACLRCGTGPIPADTPIEDTLPGVEWWCDHCERVWTVPAPGRHQPTRPAWSCQADGEVWPCRAAHDELATGWFRGDPEGLTDYLGALAAEAAIDLRRPPAETTAARFARP